MKRCVGVEVWVGGHGCGTGNSVSSTFVAQSHTPTANKKLTQMNAELAKAQEHARRFQELLAAERRKQKGLKVCQMTGSLS